MIPNKPKSDDGYLECASRIIFMGGLNRQVVDNKWPAMREAFLGFDLSAVADMTPADIERLTQDERVIRYRAKLVAVIKNAQAMAALAEEHGSFGAWVDGRFAAVGLEATAKELAKRFSYISEDGARWWLYGTGHEVGEVSEKNQGKYAPFGG
jgi:3-methyladenine DNA glycosylase Tag